MKMDQQKRQKTLLIALAVTIILAIVILILKKENRLIFKDANDGEQKIVAEEVNLDILKSGEFKELEKIGIYPVSQGKTNKSNPFSFYSLE